MRQFRVGDWVIINGTPQRVTAINPENDYNITVDMVETEYEYVPFSAVKLWEPKDGEWVCVDRYDENAFMVVRYNNSFLTIEDCEPFIGHLPNFIKGEK